MSRTRLVVLAWGNESRGDDALGPAFVARATALPDPPGLVTTYVTDFQLQPEHAIDLHGQDLALFVDASRELAAPYAFREVVPAPSATFTTHGMSPAAVLDAYRLTYGDAPPAAFELALRARGFELGSPMGVEARASLEAALAFFASLRGSAFAAAWRAVIPPPGMRAGS